MEMDIACRTPVYVTQDGRALIVIQVRQLLSKLDYKDNINEVTLGQLFAVKFHYHHKFILWLLRML